MNRWPVIESLKKIPPELVLNPSSNRDHNVPRAVLPGELEERFVCTGCPYFGATKMFSQKRDT